MGVEDVATRLFAATRPSRVTVRAALPGGSSTTELLAEVLAPGVPSMVDAPQAGIAAAPTYVWLREHLVPLVQDDCREDPLPPAMLTERFGVGAQMLGPLVDGGELIGTVSVHQEGGPRAWSSSDVDALTLAVAELTSLWHLRPRWE